jgi:hypothetical protein
LSLSERHKNGGNKRSKISVATKDFMKPGDFTRKTLPDPEIFPLAAGRFKYSRREIFFS